MFSQNELIETQTFSVNFAHASSFPCCSQGVTESRAASAKTDLGLLQLCPHLKLCSSAVALHVSQILVSFLGFLFFCAISSEKSDQLSLAC